MNAIPRLSPAERAAVFVMLLSDVDAAALLAQLGPEELEAVGTAMCAMGDVDPGRIADAIAGFIAVMIICALASLIAIRMALKVDPAEAIGG